MEIEVVGIFDDAGRAICNARRTDADPLDLLRRQTCLRDRVQRAGRHIRRDFLCGARTVGLARDLFENLIILVYESGDDIRAAEINANVILHVILPKFHTGTVY